MGAQRRHLFWPGEGVKERLGFKGQVGLRQEVWDQGASRDRGENVGAEKNIVGVGEPSVSFERL